ncbi:MAG: hypothetical protein E7586_03180 [Ruminococcaceae bacterium]|nr:hypothetical protein [Oscillospiraceae bacterium]
MKKSLALLMVLILLFAVACASTAPHRKSISLPLRFTANLKGTSSEFNVIITEDECIIGFDENHPLYGTELRFDSSGGRATVGDFSREVDLDIFPAQKALLEAFRGISSGNVTKTEEGNQTRYTIDKMTIMVYYDEDNKNIIGIETEENGRRFAFDIAKLEAYEIQSDSAG